MLPHRLSLKVIDFTNATNGPGDDAVAALLRRFPESDVALTLVSAGAGLDRWKTIANHLDRPAAILESPVLSHRFAVAQKDQAQFAGRAVHELLPQSFADCDLVWFPAIQDHLVPAHQLVKAAVSYQGHDAVEWGEWIADRSDPIESAACTARMAMSDMNNRRVMSSLARVIVESEAEGQALSQRYGPLLRAPLVMALPTAVTLGTDTASMADLVLPPHFWLCCESLSPLSQHEVLFLALARLKQSDPDAALPLLLAGPDSLDLISGRSHRGRYLRALAEHLGLLLGADLLPVAPPSATQMRIVLERARAAIQPSLAADSHRTMIAAARAGLPVVASDRPAARERLTALGLEPLWFPPNAADDLATILGRLAVHPEQWRQKAATQAADLTRTQEGAAWDKAAAGLLAAFREQAMFVALQQVGQG